LMNTYPLSQKLQFQSTARHLLGSVKSSDDDIPAYPKWL
jgi:hypothetical protein